MTNKPLAFAIAATVALLGLVGVAQADGPYGK